MIYTCNTCRFTFSRVGDVDACPDCGKPSVRQATQKEEEDFHRNQLDFSEIETDKNKK